MAAILCAEAQDRAEKSKRAGTALLCPLWRDDLFVLSARERDRWAFRPISDRPTEGAARVPERAPGEGRDALYLWTFPQKVHKYPAVAAATRRAPGARLLP